MGVAYTRFTASFEGLHHPTPSLLQVTAYTALRNHTTTPGSPSKRYLKLLVDGAVENGLPLAYIEALRSWPCYDCMGIGSSLSVLRGPQVSMTELRQHAYDAVLATFKSPGGGGGGNMQCLGDVGVWVSVAALVFDVSSHVQSRAMLKGMSNGTSNGVVDGTQFILNLWNNAYGQPVAPMAADNGRYRLSDGERIGADDVMESGIDWNGLDQNRKDYVCSWVYHMVNFYPFVGTLVS